MRHCVVMGLVSLFAFLHGINCYLLKSLTIQFLFSITLGKKAFRSMWEKEEIHNLLPYDKIVDETKLKAFRDHKLDVVKKKISTLIRVENTVGKGENSCNQHFLLFL